MPPYLTILSPRDYRLEELTPPASEPIDLAEVKAHLRLSGSEQDAEVAQFVETARLLCEAYTGKAFVTRTLALFLDAWPCDAETSWWDGVREGVAAQAVRAIRLPIAPVQSVDTIYLHDAEGGARTLAADQYIYEALGGRLSLLDAMPTGLRSMNGIEIRITAGYGAASVVPSVYKHAIRLLAAHLYTQRGDTGEAALNRCGAMALLAPFREVSLR